MAKKTVAKKVVVAGSTPAVEKEVVAPEKPLFETYEGKKVILVEDTVVHGRDFYQITTEDRCTYLKMKDTN